MTTHKEALKLALEALEREARGYAVHDELQIPRSMRDAITAIKEALANSEQEPVARVVEHGATVKLEWASADAAHNAKAGNLYTTPPQRTWVGLTGEEVIDLWPDLIMHRHTYQFWKNLEAKLKEKNTK